MKDMFFSFNSLLLFQNKLQFRASMSIFTFSPQSHSENTISLTLIHNEHTLAVICSCRTLRWQMHTPYFRSLFLALMI